MPEEPNIDSLRQRIVDDHLDYGAYVELLKSLNPSEDKAELLAIRQQFATHYPLTPEMWLKWIEDSNADDRIEICRRAVDDYISINLYMAYAESAIGSGDIGLARSVLDEAVNRVGLDVMQGHQVWQIYISFEESMASATDDGVAEARIDDLYHRLIRLPHAALDETLAAYLVRRKTDSAGEDVEADYVASLNGVQSRLPFESRLSVASTSDVPALWSIYKDYIKHEMTDGDGESDFNRVIYLYERCLAHPDADLCLNQHAWLDYYFFVRQTVRRNRSQNDDRSTEHSTCTRLTKLLADLSKRAVRNITWHPQLWVNHMRCIQDSCDPSTRRVKMDEAFGKAVASVESDKSVDIWLTYINFLRSQSLQIDGNGLDADSTVTADISNIRELFSTSVGRAIDNECRLARVWANLEATQWNDVAAARSIWQTQILPNLNVANPHKWALIVNEWPAVVEHHSPDYVRQVRKTYAKLTTKTAADCRSRFVLAELWLLFEHRVCATSCEIERVEDLLHDLRLKCRDDKRQTSDERQRRPGDGNHSVLQKKESTNITNGTEFSKDHSSVSLKRPSDRSELSNSISSEAKKHKDHNESRSQVLSSQPAKLSGTTTKIKESTPIGSVKVSGSQAGPENKPTFVRAENDPSAKNRTVFVSNLDYMLSEDRLRSIMGQSGEVTSVRLVQAREQNKVGPSKSRGYGYVEFASPSTAEAVIGRDKELVDGRPMFISRLRRSGETGDDVHVGAPQYPTHLEKTKLFVRGLPLDMDKDALLKVVSSLSGVKDVRLVTYRNGRSKGIAYIDFDSVVNAANALVSLDGKTLNSTNGESPSVLSAAFSNPPQAKDVDRSSLSLGPGPKRTEFAGRAATGGLGPRRKLTMFVPRSLHRRTAS